MKELLIEGEGLNKQGGNVWIGRGGGGGSSAVTISLGNVPGWKEGVKDCPYTYIYIYIYIYI